MSDKTTLCWNCSREYDENDDRCEHCGSTNGNINFEQAVDESRQFEAIPSAWSCVNEVAAFGRCVKWCGDGKKCVSHFGKE